jgi:murein DD-endopeptidase MepM/ murein hydrolase activator NlpD
VSTPKARPHERGICPDSPKTEGQALSRHRSPGRQQSRVLDEDYDEYDYEYSSTRTSGTLSRPVTYRIASPSSAVRGRVVVAAVAIGAFAAAAAGQTLQGHGHPKDITPLAEGTDGLALMGVGNGGVSAPDVLTVSRTIDPALEAKKMADNARVSQALAADQKAKQEQAARGKFVKPADGTFTSGFGMRWGTTHYGVDIANRIGTPILAVADGTVIEAGPASGFGLWVRIQHADGTVSVYGHVDSFSVHEGQKVKAGEQIARMGNRGYSTGPHLHFEIWDATGKKMNPAPWLADRGISL